MEYEKFVNVLEKFPYVNEINLDMKNIVVSEINNYCEEHVREKYIVSLSGGVDSMVILSILKKLNKKIICIHINYNNRDETGLEEEFLIEWCKVLDIELIVHNINEIYRNESKRSYYEDMTKEIRFNLYKKIININRCSEVILGHHKDDIIENVFNISHVEEVF